MTKIKYTIAQSNTTAEVFASAASVNKNYNQVLGTITVDYIRGENNETRAARALDTFLKNQATKAAKKSRTNLESFKSALNINVFEEIVRVGLVEIWREAPPFAVYLRF